VISFIVPAYNEEQLIGATLSALHASARALGEEYELVVADDASSDLTVDIAAHHDAQVVQVAHRQIAATRNSGAGAARGEILVFVDADTLVDAGVVKAALAALRAGAVGGGATVGFEADAPRYARLLLPWFARLYRALGLAPGCFLFCTRAAFDAVGGFDQAYFGAEEVVLSRALKRQGRFVVLKESVLTSSRKLRDHGAFELLAAMLRLALGGRRAVQRREGMEFWYAPRRGVDDR
jgi:glycosyltransferase involved in cell wall biosynthesis